MIEDLYQTHRPWLVRWCAAMTGDPAAAEDIVQDVFLRAMTHIDTLEELSAEQTRAWLRRAAKNRYIDLVRRVQGEPEPEAELSYNDDHTASVVASLCMTLPPEEQTLFVMRYFEGYNSTELGELFALSPATVRSRLASARRKLRKHYLADE